MAFLPFPPQNVAPVGSSRHRTLQSPEFTGVFGAFTSMPPEHELKVGQRVSRAGVEERTTHFPSMPQYVNPFASQSARHAGIVRAVTSHRFFERVGVPETQSV